MTTSMIIMNVVGAAVMTMTTVMNTDITTMTTITTVAAAPIARSTGNLICMQEDWEGPSAFLRNIERTCLH